MQNIESKNKDEIIKWDYEVSVKKVSAKVKEWKAIVLKKSTLTDEIVWDLFKAREELSDRGSWSRNNVTTARGWSRYLEDVGLQRMTVHRWLEHYDPIEQRLLTDDEFQRKKEIKKREILEHKEQIQSKVQERIKTSVKPDDWDRETERVYKKTVEENIAREKRNKKYQQEIEEEAERLEKERIKGSKPKDDFEKMKGMLNGLSDLFDQKQNHREELGLSGNEEIKQDVIYDIIDEYLIKLDSDSRRIEALHNILKYTKRKINHYQTQVGV